MMQENRGAVSEDGSEAVLIFFSQTRDSSVLLLIDSALLRAAQALFSPADSLKTGSYRLHILYESSLVIAAFEYCKYNYDPHDRYTLRQKIHAPALHVHNQTKESHQRLGGTYTSLCRENLLRIHNQQKGEE